MTTTMDNLVDAIGAFVTAMGTQQPAQQNVVTAKLPIPVPTFEGKPHENIVAWNL